MLVMANRRSFRSRFLTRYRPTSAKDFRTVSSSLSVAPVYVDPSVISVLTSPHSTAVFGDQSFDLTWYPRWLASQLARLPPSLRGLLVKTEKGQLKLSKDSELYRVFFVINDVLCASDGSLSIDNMVESIQREGYMNSEISPLNTSEQRLLVFAVLGWQTMLYQPSFNTCPPAELAIHHEMQDPDSSLVFTTFRVPTSLADQPLELFLPEFGRLLPSVGAISEPFASETTDPASTQLSCSDINAYYLHALLQINVRWVDCIALHLDYDHGSRNLQVFRFPSLCATLLQHKGSLHSLGIHEENRFGSGATVDDISALLQEILLSYRLLFGQSHKSRNYLRRLLRSSRSIADDDLLFSLSTEEGMPYAFDGHDKESYYLERDFPILRSRLEFLHGEIKKRKPKGWKHLFQNRRDRAQSSTLWLVAICGVVIIVLNLVQCIMFGIQLGR